MYTVTLPEAAWNQILNILGERQFREVNNLINAILQQTSKQAQQAESEIKPRSAIMNANGRDATQ